MGRGKSVCKGPGVALGGQHSIFPSVVLNTCRRGSYPAC